MIEGAIQKAMSDPKIRKDLEAKGVIIQFKGRKAYRAFLKNSQNTITSAAKRVGLYKRKN